MKPSRMEASNLVVGSCMAALSAWEAGVSANCPHEDDALEMLSLYAHLHRFPTSAVPDDIKSSMVKVVERDVGTLFPLAVSAMKRIAAGWKGAFKSYIETINENRLGPEEDKAEALDLWQAMDDTSLAADAIFHLVPKEERPRDWPATRLAGEEMGLVAMRHDGVFVTIRRYIYELHDAYLAEAEMPEWVRESTLPYWQFNAHHRDTVYDDAERDMLRRRLRPVIRLSDYQPEREPILAAASVDLWDSRVAEELAESRPRTLMFRAESGQWTAEATIPPGADADTVAVFRVRGDARYASGVLVLGERNLQLQDGMAVIRLADLAETWRDETRPTIGLRGTDGAISWGVYEPEGR